MAKKQQHVVPDPDGGWNVKKAGAKRATKHFNTKKEAVDYGKEVSENQGAELVKHRKDGTIEDSDSYGNDPYPPKDKTE